jgi:hypothetical protein
VPDQDGSDGPSPDDRSRPRPSARYSGVVGILFLALIAVATVSTIGSDEGGVLGSEDVRGRPLPEFAVPDVRGQLEGDANVFQDDCETRESPCPADARRSPACEIDPEGAIRVCDLFDRPLVISFWFTTPADCPPTQDAVDQVARRYRDRVNFLSIAVRGERDEILEIIEERGWDLPVGWDRDGGVSNLYQVGVCPTVGLAYPGGIFQSATVGPDNVSVDRLAASVERLLQESEARAREDR